MANKTDPAAPPRRLLKWATSPPQSYAVYLVLLILVWLVSFYAGTLNPKRGPIMGPPPASAPQQR